MEFWKMVLADITALVIVGIYSIIIEEINKNKEK